MPKYKKEKLVDLCCDDKATIFVFVLNTIAFGAVIAGLIEYFLQYQYVKDQSDEKWIYPVLWIIPTFAWLLGLGVQLATTFKHEKSLCIIPFLSVISTLSLLFICFIFFQAFTSTMNGNVCNQGAGTLDNECLVSKDGHQICGHFAIDELCFQIQVGFYLLFMGCILMAGTQLLLITTSCVRRSRAEEERQYRSSYFKMNNQIVN